VRADRAVAGQVAGLLSQRLYLVFEPEGVREVVFGADDPAQLAEQTNAGAFTFPRALARRWSYDAERPGGARVAVAVHDEMTAVRGAKTALWVAKSTTRTGTAGEPVIAAAAFARLGASLGVLQPRPIQPTPTPTNDDLQRML
jgi:hypothetical protein